MKKDIFDVSNRVVVITGGMGQIGAEFVKEFFNRKAKVVVLSRSASKEKALKVFGSEIVESPNFMVSKVDISNKVSINNAFDLIENEWGCPDILINNAGIDTQPTAPPEVSGPFEDFPEEVFREVVETNLTGTFLMIQAFGKRLVGNNKPGSIINVGSIYGMVSPVQDIYAYKEEMTGVAFVKPVAYCAAKSGIYNLTRYCATYWGKKNIRVNALTPSGVWRENQDEFFHANYESRIPIGRMAQADEYNGAVIFLASDASKYMTGSNLIVDGGWTAW
ncbi:MAG: SDR family oxidoreductase [Spirochaetaceae bacterium]|nr:SDR family oxidoreductase [Spirochaetaceae bacterium]